MVSRKHGKWPPAWAPSDLVSRIEELRDKQREHSKRLKDAELRILDKRADLEKGQLYIGRYYLMYDTQIEIGEALASSPGMELVWKRLLKRRSSFKPRPFLIAGGMTPASNLFGACVEIENNWINLPQRTRAQAREMYSSIAALSNQLIELLLEVSSRDLLDVTSFIEHARRKAFIDSLEGDGHDIWYGFDGYLDHLLGELVEPIPGLLLKLQKRALEHAQQPVAVSQPNSRNAKINYFIQALSDYFTRSYGQPLHAHVAAVVNAVLGANADEDRVRALLRARKHRQHATRKKNSKLEKSSTG